MKPARRPIQRHPRARLLYVAANGALAHLRRGQLAQLVRPGDVVVANDAATLPASLPALHERTGSSIEVRLAGRSSLDPADVLCFVAVVFGAGDHRTRTEDRPLPDALHIGDRLRIGATTALIDAFLDHPRFVQLRFEADTQSSWRLLAQAGRPIQYAHIAEPLALWDVWTPIAANPVAYEPPSASFALDWETLVALRAQGARFVTLTHAAGISSTGDARLDARLPLDEPYFIPTSTAHAISIARARRGRVLAIGTTVVRALEHAASAPGGLRAGAGLATQRIDESTQLRVVDAILSGTHEMGSSHYDLLRAFAADEVLTQISYELVERDYLTHEFGDSVLIEAQSRPVVREAEQALRAVPPPVRKVSECVDCV